MVMLGGLEALKEIMARGRGSRLAAALPLCVFLVSAGIVLLGLFNVFRSTSRPPESDDVRLLAPTELFPSSASFTTLLSNLSSANSSLGGVESAWRPTVEDDGDGDDEELLRRASSMGAGAEEVSGGAMCPRKKVAFMFLTKGRMPLRRLWELFFTGHEGYFSIYLHTSPEFNEEPPDGSVFFDRRIPSKPVRWGRASMVDAERRLVAQALLDPCNERFVLLSESCIPLFNFSTVHSHLLGSALSFVSSFDDPRRCGRGRYDPRMSPAVTLREWRKGSQWFEAHRRLAAAVVSDGVYYAVFRMHCRPPCYMDEHYVPTLVTKLLPWLNSNRSLTWLDWSKGGSHPATFRGRHVSGHFIERVRRGSRCTYNGRPTTLCFLFARKFDGSTLGPLLRLAPALLGLIPSA